MNKKNQKYENSAIALDQTLITASVLCFLLILYFGCLQIGHGNRFVKKKQLELLRPLSVPFSIFFYLSQAGLTKAPQIAHFIYEIYVSENSSDTH